MNWLRKFMYGRYGIDALHSFIFKIYVFLVILNIFLRLSIISYIEIILLIVMLCRIFSKNIYSRSNENVRFLKLKKNIVQYFNNIKTNKMDKNHIYRKCRKCHRTLKLPLPDKMGFKTIKCPKCGKKKKTLILRKQKIEIIKKKK